MESLDCLAQFSSKTAGYWSGQRGGGLMRGGEGAVSWEIRDRSYEEREKGFSLTVWTLLRDDKMDLVQEGQQQVNMCRDLMFYG